MINFVNKQGNSIQNTNLETKKIMLMQQAIENNWVDITYMFKFPQINGFDFSQEKIL